MKVLLTVCAGVFLVSASAQADSGAVAYDAIQKGKWVEAEAQLRAGLKENPNDPMRLLNLAYVLQNTGRTAEANTLYQQVLKLERDPLVAIGLDSNVRPARAKIIAKKGLASLETK
jgi:Flp pilus assembly protein TadD